METIEEIAKEYEKKLTDAYVRANTKSKRKRIVQDLFQFSSICYEHFGIEKGYEWERDIDMITLSKNYKIPFAQNITKYDKLYSNIFNTVLNTFIDSNYSVYDYSYKGYRRITEKDLQDIIFSFLESYDKNLLEVFKKKIDDKELFYASLYGYNGLTYTMPSINKNLIFYTTEKDEVCTIETASTIVHEIGHTYEMTNLYKTGRNNFYDLTFGTPYYEISSRYLQYAFINYLKDNKFYSPDVEKLMHGYLYELLCRTYDIVLLSSMKEIVLDSLDNAPIKDEKTIKLAKDIQEKLNYFSLASDKDDIIKYRFAYIYGIGSLLSIYLYDSYKKDPVVFKKEFRNSLLNYPYMNSLSAFENVGITEDILIKGDVLRKVLKNSE